MSAGRRGDGVGVSVYDGELSDVVECGGSVVLWDYVVGRRSVGGLSRVRLVSLGGRAGDVCSWRQYLCCALWICVLL